MCPLPEQLLKRGAVFLWRDYARLDDPTVASKDKYLLLINAHLPDDPLYYLLTTSRVEKYSARNPFDRDLLRIPAGSYEFFQRDTVINVANAGELVVGLGEFEALRAEGAIEFVGCLSAEDVRELDQLIVNSLRVRKDLKRLITAW